MIKCSKCNHEEFEGALFCSECGMRLVEIDPSAFLTTSVGNTDIINIQDEEEKIVPQNNSLHPVQGKEYKVFVQMMDSDKKIPLEGRKEFSFGRISDGQLILPDIDLTEFDAYSQGVSRLHASISIQGTMISISDLASSNGTRVNGQKIEKHINYPLSNGDIVALGKLSFKIIIEEKK